MQYERDDNDDNLSYQKNSINSAEEDETIACFIDAVKAGDQSEVDRLLVIHPVSSLDAADQQGYSALHYAVASGNLAIVGKLLDHGANINIQTDKTDSETPILLAVKKRHSNVLKELLRRGTDSMRTYMDGWTVLHTAIRLSETDITAILLAHPRSSALVDIGDSSAMTALHYCADNEWPAQARVLLQNSAKVNSEDLAHRTPLLILLKKAETVETETLVKLLLDAGAEVDTESLSNREREAYEGYMDRRGRGSVVTLSSHSDNT